MSKKFLKLALIESGSEVFIDPEEITVLIEKKEYSKELIDGKFPLVQYTEIHTKRGGLYKVNAAAEKIIATATQ